MRKIIAYSLLILLLLLIIKPLSAAKITAVKVGSKINVSIDDKFFTSYIFSSDEKYPFFFPVNGPISGGSVTSMRNDPYPHQASLFFACDQVNGGIYGFFAPDPMFWPENGEETFIKKGEIKTFRFRVLVHGGNQIDAKIAEVYDEFRNYK